MRKVLFFVAVAAFISVGYALGKPARPTLAAPVTHNLTGACAKANLKLVHDGQFTLGSDFQSYPPWWDGHPKKGTPFKISNPYSGKGYESALSYAIAKRAGLHTRRGQVDARALPQGHRTGPEALRLLHRSGFGHAGASEGRDLLELLLRGQPGRRGTEEERHQQGEDRGRPQAIHAGHPGRDDEL